VLSLPEGRVAGSVALKRIFDSKLSVLSKTKAGVISSGYSQGLIDDFPELRAAAERIAIAIHSEGPLNIQGRVRSGKLIPFEINPRFSASTYLRALAGFNEVDVYLQHVINGIPVSPAALKVGYYLRSFEEVFVSKDKVVS
jgi:carbamoyl-phosphate synthase large subunit